MFKKLKPYMPIVAGIIILAFVVTIVIVVFWPSPDLLAQYITHRTCDFIEFGELHAAVCADGSQWSVSPFSP